MVFKPCQAWLPTSFPWFFSPLSFSPPPSVEWFVSGDWISPEQGLFIS